MNNDADFCTVDNYETRGGIEVEFSRREISYEHAVDSYIERLDSRRGAVLSSNYEYPGRYTRWDTAIIDPPITISAQSFSLKIEAHNERGQILLEFIADKLEQEPSIVFDNNNRCELSFHIVRDGQIYSEEERSRMPSVFTVIRAIVDLFYYADDGNLGLYGAFGYDLAFQFDDIERHLDRADNQRDLVLFLPDEILVVDHHMAKAYVRHYDFSKDGKTTKNKDAHIEGSPFKKAVSDPPRGDHSPGEYAELVVRAKESFRRGDLFEVVPGQTFFEKCRAAPSAIARKLKQINPSPYSFYMNLGEQEYLVGASPEMFVRVTGRRVETCPISGTIKRGEDAISDSEQILKLLNSKKEESELTMCSDVDRNDKSRVCEPGSVRVIGRRQIEMYSRLIHTVDHIEGRLRKGMDALDAFLSHAWAVTVTGAPKLWAMRFIEKNERSARAWYGGAIGLVGFDGNMNTGLTLRTVRIKNGIAEVRAGATLLYDSDPADEEAETELKASAMLAAIREAGKSNTSISTRTANLVGLGRRILLVDHEDSFVHTLANDFRETGAEVKTVRSPLAEEVLNDFVPDLVVMSPGPGNPKDFNCSKTIEKILARNIPIFGVCLGLQAVIEHFGGKLKRLDVPMHGKPSRISTKNGGIVFSGLDNLVTVGRYHSLAADEAFFPECMKVTVRTDDNVVMGIEHKTLPIAAVQFHPESIMSLGKSSGMRMIENVVSHMIK